LTHPNRQAPKQAVAVYVAATRAKDRNSKCDSDLAARKFKRAFAAVVSASGEGTLRVVPLGSMTRA
jgi:hypothetical protein